MEQHFNKDCSSNTGQNKEGPVLLIAAHVNAALHTIAIHLQLKTERLTKRKQKIFLLLFSLLFSGGNIAIIFYSFAAVRAPPSTPKITFPKYVLIHAPKLKIRDSLISNQEYVRISQFRHYLVHLQDDAKGKRIYDSLMQARPFLLDSIHQVDSIYLNQ